MRYMGLRWLREGPLISALPLEIEARAPWPQKWPRGHKSERLHQFLEAHLTK
jgi:hypothetical protein